MKLWIATYVDTSDTSDCKPQVLAVCNSKVEAEAAVYDDMKDWIDHHGTLSVKADFTKMSAWSECRDESCEWNISEVDAEKRMS